LSFNKLRKTSSTALRKLSGGEVAGIFLAHGNPVPSDILVDFYANRDFTAVHEACDKWRERLASVFAGLAAPFVKERRKHQKPEATLEKRRRIVALRAEKRTLKQIGQEVGLSINAVRHHLLQAGIGSSSRPSEMSVTARTGGKRDAPVHISSHCPAGSYQQFAETEKPWSSPCAGW
jgi:hypothetical protein